MIRKKRKRERVGKARSAFRLRGAEVEDSSIMRFQKRQDIRDQDEMSDVGKHKSYYQNLIHDLNNPPATPVSLVCYTPESSFGSCSPSPDQRNFLSSSTQGSNALFHRNTPSPNISTGKPSPQVFLSWSPTFDPYFNSSVKYELFFMNDDGSNLDGRNMVDVRNEILFSVLIRVSVPNSTLFDYHLNNSDALIYTHCVSSQEGLLQRFRLSMEDLQRAVCIIQPEPFLANLEPCGELESLVNSHMAALGFSPSLPGMLLDCKSILRARYTPERLSEVKSTNEPTHPVLSLGNSPFDTDRFHNGESCFEGRLVRNSRAFDCRCALLEYSGSNDPTLTKAATWNELMEVR